MEQLFCFRFSSEDKDIHLFLFNKYLLSSCNMPGTVQIAREKSVLSVSFKKIRNLVERDR